MFNKTIISNILIIGSALLATCALNATAAEKKVDDMTCKEFISLNPETMSPVAFWIYNDDDELKGGDYVSLEETTTIAVPMTIKLCKDNPESKIKKFESDVKKEISKID